jgi:hypothetical protein
MMRGCENHNLEMLIGLLQAFKSVWSHIDPCIHDFSIGEGDFKYDIWVVSLRIIHTMNKSLVQVENDGPIVRVMGRRKINLLAFEKGIGGRIDCVYVLDGLKGLNQMSLVQVILSFRVFLLF